MFDEPVRYHGSLTAHHGPATYLGPCPCQACADYEAATAATEWDGLGWVRSRLELPDGQVLEHVHPVHFTRLPPPPPAPATPEPCERCGARDRRSSVTAWGVLCPVCAYRQHEHDEAADAFHPLTAGSLGFLSEDE